MDQLRALQLKELDILKAVAKVCDEKGITYFLNSGTLLGAVRHGGFIPWDDDIDIAMNYADYERFLSCAQELLGDRFFVQNMETEPDFNFSFTRVRMNGTTCMDSYKAKWNVHQGVWIDVFPIVPLRDKADFKISRKVFSLCNYFHSDYALKYYYDEYYKLLGPVGIAALRVFYMIPMATRIKWHEAIVRKMCLRRNRECRSVLWGNITTFYPENVFTETTTILFEGIPFLAPKDTDKYLSITYGDYMTLPPMEKRHTHALDTVDLEHDYHRYMDL